MKILCFYSDEEEKMKFDKEFPNIVFFKGRVQDLKESDFKKYQDVVIITAFIDSTFSAQTIDKFPNLRLIATRSTGKDHIDIDFCEEKNIEIRNVPDYGSNTVAEHVFALLLSLSKNIFSSYNEIKKNKDFSSMGSKDIRGLDLFGKTIGVLGTGNIGKNVIRIAKGFQMNILANDINPDKNFAEKNNIVYTNFDELLEKSDIISINIPLCDDTFHLFSYQQFEKMKKGVIIINTSRGEIINSKAFYEALKSEKIAGAGLDVLEEEKCLEKKEEKEGELCNEITKKINEYFILSPRVIITPHNAFNTKEALERIYEKTVQNIKTFSI